MFAPSIPGLRELLKVCDVFADSHDIKYNPNKSQVLISRGKFLSGVTIPPVCIGGSCIPETDTVKYLGHFICNTMRDDNGVARIFVWGGPLFHDLRRPTRFSGGGGSSRNFSGSP